MWPQGSTLVDVAMQGTTLVSADDHSLNHRQIGSIINQLPTVFGTTPGTNILGAFVLGNFAMRVNNSNVPQAIVSGGTFNNITAGTPAITGGTFNNGVLGTPAITGGTHNTGVFGTPSVLGGTINASLRILGSNAYSPGTSTTGTIDLSTGNRFLVNLPATAGSITLVVINGANNQPFLIEALQGAAGNGTINWFGLINWLNSGTSAPTQGTTPGRKATYGFIQTGAGTFDGYAVGKAE